MAEIAGEDVLQLAMFLQQKDAREFGILQDGVAHPLWGEADPAARERYLADAGQLLVAVGILGYLKGPSGLLSMGEGAALVGALARVEGERDRARATGVRLEQELAQAEAERDALAALTSVADSLLMDALAKSRREGWRPAGGLVSE